MSDDVLRAHRIDPVVPEFVPDAALGPCRRVRILRPILRKRWPRRGIHEQEKPAQRIGDRKGLERNDPGHRTRVGKKGIERAREAGTAKTAGAVGETVEGIGGSGIDAHITPVRLRVSFRLMNPGIRLFR